MDIAGIMDILNKKSGVQGISQLSSDFRDLEEGMEKGNELAKDAIDVFCYRVAKYIGSYAAAMNGVDVIAFTAGIGENAPMIREKVMGYLGYLGISIDKSANGNRGKDLVIYARFKSESLYYPNKWRACHCKRDGSPPLKKFPY